VAVVFVPVAAATGAAAAAAAVADPEDTNVQLFLLLLRYPQTLVTANPSQCFLGHMHSSQRFLRPVRGHAWPNSTKSRVGCWWYVVGGWSLVDQGGLGWLAGSAGLLAEARSSILGQTRRLVPCTSGVHALRSLRSADPPEQR